MGGVRGCALGRGARPYLGGCPAALVLPHPLAPLAWNGGARPQPALPLAGGLGLRRRLVSPALAPVGEGGAQGLGLQLLASASVMRSTAPPSRKAGDVDSPGSGDPRRLRPWLRRRGGGRLVPGSRGWGGDEVPRVGVDVAEVGVVVLVALGVVRRHLLDAGGNAPQRLDLRLRGCPAPCPLLSGLPFPRDSRAPTSNKESDSVTPCNSASAGSA